MRVSWGIAATVLACATGAALAKPVGSRRVGAGVMVGQPTALTGYVSLSRTLAADLAVGWVSTGYHELIVHADLLWLFAEAGGGSATVPFYVGAGFFVLDDYGDRFAGLRVPFGLAVHVPSARLQIFGEVSLQVSLYEGRDVPRTTDTEAAVGLRFFF
jgi:hypothetical protein